MNTLSIVESVFLAALEKDTPEARAAYLEEACGGDANLRQCVERLLRAHPRAGDFLQAPAVLPPTEEATPLTEQPGCVIGPYKLLQELGEGGFGVVFLAEQTESVRRKVALKVIKPGMDSKQVVARFEQERQALAMMDHPNIARVLDGGTTESGRPFFVMELVKGVPITTFCDQNRLSARERLELFGQVCQAIQHAHQKGVIHRDIKPSNVLVALYDDRPVVKVIDFGVAKAVGAALTEQTLFTRVGQVIGTLEYMSPEQASHNALDVDTRSDVYALGVLLYELLTGSTPLEKGKLRAAGFAEMLRLIREEEPPRPSDRLSGSGEGLPALAAYRKTESQQLPKLVRGELDWITMKALEKDRARRYGSAADLAADVERYLRDEQVEACPPSWAYRAGKFLRRHRAAFTLAGTVVFLLLVGAVVSSCLAWWATRAEANAANERNVAQQERDKARQERDKTRDLLVTVTQKSREVQAAHLATRRAHYNLSMTQIAASWQADDLRRVAKLLGGLRPGPDEQDLRSFEWHYWDRMLHPERHEEFVAESPVFDASNPDNVAALSGNGTRAAFRCYPTKDGDPLLKVVEVASGKVLFFLPAREGRRQVFNLALSHDGRRLAFFLPQSEVKPSLLRGELKLDRKFVEVWEVHGPNDRPIFARKTSQDSFWFCRPPEFSPDGDRLVTAEGFLFTKFVNVWNLSTPDAEAILRARLKTDGNTTHPRLLPFAFNSDGTRLALVHTRSARDGGVPDVEVWDVAAGKRCGQLPVRARIESIAFSPDGKHLAGVTKWSEDGPDRQSRQVEDQVFVWSGADGDELKEIRAPKTGSCASPSLFQNNVSALSYSPDGKMLAVYRRGNTREGLLHGVTGGKVRLLDAATGAEVRVLKTIGLPEAVVFGAGGTRLSALVSDHAFSSKTRWTWMEWAVAGPLQDTPVPPEPKVQTVRSPNGERLATCTSHTAKDRAEGRMDRITITDRDGKELCVVRTAATLLGVTFSPNGRFLLSEEGGIGPNASVQCKIWDTDTGDLRREFNHYLIRRYFTMGEPLDRNLSKRQHRFLSRDHRLLAIPDKGGVSVVTFDTLEERFHVEDAREVYFSNDGRRLFCIHRMENGAPSRIHPIKVWDVETGRELASYSPEEVEVAFDPGYRRFLVRKEGESATVLEEIGVEQRRIVLKTGAARTIGLLRFSPDGTRLLTQAMGAPNRSGRQAIRVWDVKSGEELFHLEGPVFWDTTFSPDSKRIVGLGRDYSASDGDSSAEAGRAPSQNAVKVWDATTGHELLSLRLDDVDSATPVFSPDGHRLTTTPTLRSGSSNKIRTWDATPREEPQR